MFAVKVDVAVWRLDPKPIPVLRIERGGLAEKTLSALVGEYAGRVFAAIPHNACWSISLGRLSDAIGVVSIDTLRGEPGEVLAALQVLRSVIGN